MPIPRAQLDTWSHPGATVTSASAYASIQYALQKAGSPLANRGIEIFLQGSYANSTNIFGDSDIDVVVLYGNTFGKDLSSLTTTQQQLHEQTYETATYRWENLKADVFSALRSHYGANSVVAGNKAISVRTPSGTRPADVIPAIQFRRYSRFISRDDLLAHWGIQFFDSSGNAIVNYPKYHIDRGEQKNSAARTEGQYKPTVRVFKNLRNCLIERNMLADGIVPSYFLECALYNVPDAMFRVPLATRVPAIIAYFLATDRSGMISQNGVIRLFGVSSTQWSEANLLAFVNAATRLWDNW